MKRKESSPLVEQLGENRAALARLAGSGEAKLLMKLLEQPGGVQRAAREAAQGDAGALLEMVTQLMKTGEGAALVEKIEARAREEGLH